MAGSPSDAPARVRLDKWLWAARFFKTRSAAAQAVDGGKVDVNGERAKRAHQVQPGETVTVPKRPAGFSLRRFSASQCPVYPGS